jgi:hypothetical protein
MDLFGKKKKAAQKAQDEKKAASERPKSMPPRPMPKPEDNIKNKQAQNPNEERPKGASPRPPMSPAIKDKKAAELLKQKMDQSKGQQDPRQAEDKKYPRPPMKSIKEKQGQDPNQRTNLPPERPKPLVPKTEESKQYQDPKQRTNLPPERPKYLPPLTSPTSPKGNQYPPSPSPQEKDYGRPPGASPIPRYPQQPQGQEIKKARKDHFWDGHKKPMSGPNSGYNPSPNISSQYPRPSDPDEGGSMANKPSRPKGPSSPGGAFPNDYEMELRKRGAISNDMYKKNPVDKYGEGK